ncbi:MAG: redox-regulated ATPase YchF [Anaerolineales bacterium]|nr:MAG: redox-regulated ATPase YchF [Anaerolineales bacterium]
MRLGIIGLPQAGKTTVFNALTRGGQPTTTSGGKFEVRTAVVAVPDPRLDSLVALFRPRDITHARVTYADIAGLDGSAGKAGLSGPLLNQLSQVDGFLEVVRCFEDERVPHSQGQLDPCRDISLMDQELLLQDLISVERKLERLGEERHRSGGRDKVLLEREIALFEKLHAALLLEKPLRDLELSAEEEKSLAGYGFLTRKPILILLNLSEGQTPPDVTCPYQRCGVALLQGKLEMEIVQLPPEEAGLFMAEFGIQEPGLNMVIRLSYDLLGRQSFFTVGEDEVRAWTIPNGATAYQAAGAIHTDLQKGFIRAEVVAYEDLLSLGGLAEARARGKLRLEGKEYILKDGEIMHVRFNV